MKTYLKYIGKGSFLPHAPARDLTREEADKFVYHDLKGVQGLLQSGLYELAEKEKATKTDIKGDQ